MKFLAKILYLLCTLIEFQSVLLSFQMRILRVFISQMIIAIVGYDLKSTFSKYFQQNRF